jgi:oligopeptide/dipeptide ABC transporter ATP-binding protein
MCGLSVNYRTRRGTVRALRDIDLVIPHNRVVGIVGESGCGKSTLIAAILGLLTPNAEIAGGRIEFGGKDLLSASQEQLRSIRGQQIAPVFQDPMTSLNPVLPIATQMIDIQYRSAIGKAEKRRRAVEMLTRVGIADAEQRLRDYAHHFSGGMRQRIAIAMALLMRPALLIMDEPTTALDVTLEAQVIHLLRSLRHEIESSILFVSHNLSVVAELCDEVAVMYAGEVVEHAPVRELFHAPRHPYTRLLLACDPARLADNVAILPTIAGALPDLTAPLTGCLFAPRCPDATAACTVSPPYRRVGPGHAARCIFADG